MSTAENQRVAGTRAFRTVKSLSEAAISVFEGVGFHHAQVSDIAERAGVSRATFYNYFSSKEELLQRMVHDTIPDLLGTDVQNVEEPDSIIGRIRASTRAYLRAYQRNATLMHVWSEAAHRNPDMARLLHDSREPFLMRTEQSIRRLQAKGYAPRLDARYAAHALTGMVSNFAYTWFVEGEDYDADLAVTTLTELWASALGIPSEDFHDADR
jgi:AcrR family transcriptional regulator